ncbi:MAG: SAM-dependent methyltransferase [Bacteroidota bacterium]
MKITHQDNSSFRDPSGFIFRENGRLLRQVNRRYKNDYDHLMRSGLYEKLVSRKLLIPHTEITGHTGLSEDCYIVIAPEKVNFISYAYEWSFSQLKDAALATLQIQNTALKHGMVLKDASVYNIQFHKGMPIHIDTLSFEIYQDNTPWQAYRQFVQHFLAPLALMSHTDIRLNQLLKSHLDGVPLDLTAKLLPWRTKLNLGLFLHIHAHSRAQKKYQKPSSSHSKSSLSRQRLQNLIKSLWQVISKLKVREKDTEWAEYYSFTNYSHDSFNHKKEIIREMAKQINPSFVWDMGANTGEFTQIISQCGIPCIAFDIDPLAVEKHYAHLRNTKSAHTLPLLLDVTNPSPAIGWGNRERMDLAMREKPDTIMALALIHHLAISNNIPLHKIAEYFSELCTNLIIEFVPKEDSQVQLLLASREDIFQDYTKDSFIKAFSAFFQIITERNIEGSTRSLFLMQKPAK